MSGDVSTVIDELARAQHGLVTSAQAVKALGPGRKDRWVAAGRLVSIQPRVFRVLGAPPTWHQALKAAELSTGGVVSHRSAAELWGLVQRAGYVEVSVKQARAPRAQPPTIVHRIADLHDELAVEREGVQLTDPTRTIIDLGLVLPIWSVGDALSRALTSRLLTLGEVERLRDALGRKGRDGTGVVRSLLEDRRQFGGVEESMLERRLVELVRSHDLERPALQHEVWHAGRFVARIDAAYPDRKIAIEVDGYGAHTSPEAFQRDRTRQNHLVTLGWTVLRFTWADVVDRPAMVAQEIRAALLRAAAA